MPNFCVMCDHPIEPGKDIEWAARFFVCRNCAPPEILNRETIEILRDSRYLFNGELTMAAMVSVAERLR